MYQDETERLQPELHSHPTHEPKQGVHADVASTAFAQVRINDGLDLGVGLPIMHGQRSDRFCRCECNQHLDFEFTRLVVRLTSFRRALTRLYDLVDIEQRDQVQKLIVQLGVGILWACKSLLGRCVSILCGSMKLAYLRSHISSAICLCHTAAPVNPHQPRLRSAVRANHGVLIIFVDPSANKVLNLNRQRGF